MCTSIFGAVNRLGSKNAIMQIEFWCLLPQQKCDYPGKPVLSPMQQI